MDRITVTMVRNKAIRIGRMLQAPDGKKFYLSEMNPGDGNRYQIGWKDIITGGETPIGYNWHVKGRQMYYFLEGIEEAILWQKPKQKL
jgi:hypothetical protein